jgi:hypothetical protein
MIRVKGAKSMTRTNDEDDGDADDDNEEEEKARCWGVVWSLDSVILD